MKSLSIPSQGKMRTAVFLVVLAVLGAWSLPRAAQADDYAKTINTFKQSAAARPFFNTAYAYAVLPSIGKAGLGVGGAYGTGRMYRDGKVVGQVTLAKGTVGLQAGAEEFSEIIFLKDKQAYDKFTRGNFQFAADASAVAVNSGAQARAEGGGGGTSAGAGAGGGSHAVNYKDGMAVFVNGTGLMAEASIGGQKFSFTPKSQE